MGNISERLLFLQCEVRLHAIEKSIARFDCRNIGYNNLVDNIFINILKIQYE